jgi:hypothetical protein
MSPVASPRSRRADGSVSTIRWWYAGVLIDILHMPLVIAMVLLGATVWSGTVYASVVTAVVVAQVAVMGCPVMAITGWMKRKHDPDFEAPWSFTYWLYQRYGKAVGIGVFFFFLVLALGLRQLW